MRFLVVIVNYNNSKITGKCIESIIKNNMDIKIVVVDNNSNNNEKKILNNYIKYCDIIYLNNNIGYFKGLNAGLENQKLSTYKYVIIGNNDLLFPIDFFLKLSKKSYQDDYYAICPNIVTIDDVHQNPHEIQNISKYRQIMYTLYYTNYYFGQILFLIQQLIKKITRKKNRVKDWELPKEIFMGYGAIYILTSAFFKKNKILNYKNFLMGEELFLSWQIFKTNGKLFYDPTLEIKHLEHASVVSLSNRKMYEYSKESFLEFRKIWNKIDFTFTKK